MILVKILMRETDPKKSEIVKPRVTPSTQNLRASPLDSIRLPVMRKRLTAAQKLGKSLSKCFTAVVITQHSSFDLG